ncbi:MAG: Gfo/Idh/MocA family oxidoreductase, partial [Acidobacteria bacterium]|nr:Gfo/Idh/MocA family oxidoreductase [Acidobacteriota bacterium]
SPALVRLEDRHGAAADSGVVKPFAPLRRAPEILRVTPEAPRSDSQPLRIALIGTGKMGLNHLRAIAGCTGATVVGVADPQADAEALGPLLPPDAVIVESAQALFERARPDIVHIVTPPATHAALAAEAIEAGAHVYVEKPFTLRRADAEHLVALAARRGRRVVAGHQCLFQHSALRGRDSLGQIGTIVHIESYFSFRQVRRSMSPVEQAKDILPHAVYMLVDLLRAARPGDDTPIRLDALQASADGSVFALLSLGTCRGILVVTLTGRPVEQYAHVVGTNGSLRIDLVADAVTSLVGPGASAPSALLAPSRLAWQGVTRSTAGFARQIRERKYGYPGLRTLCQRFYDSIRADAPPPISPDSIVETVGLCEQVGMALDEAERQAEAVARHDLEAATRAVLPVEAGRGVMLVTGAAGFLGARLVRELRSCGWPVRAIVRQPLRAAQQEPGVEYRVCDLAGGVSADLMAGVTTVVHCAAETRGGKADQSRNSIGATRALIDAATAAGVVRFVHVSSVAVMRPGASSRPLDESAPLDVDTLARGPYVWGKAESERLVVQLGRERGLQVRVVRLGPLVDFAAFEPPGRLGRELGPMFVAVGPKKRRIALCDVGTAAAVLRSYVEDFDAAPPLVNLVEPDAPTRSDLVARLRSVRPDLRVRWMPWWLLRTMSPPLRWAQRLLLGSKEPLDIASAFTSPAYATSLAAEVVARARQKAAPAPRGDEVGVS